MKVAAIQFDPKLKEIEQNRRKMVEFSIQAAEGGARLIVFPEMATTGYVWNDQAEIMSYVEELPGESVNMFSEVTKKYDCYIVYGIAERDRTTGTLYNSAVLIGPEGYIGAYRKTHLYAADPRWAREGKDEIPVFDTSIGKIAILICMDAMYFEPSRIAALKGADIIAFPTNWVGKENKPTSKTWTLRAKENGVSWIAANRCGEERGAQFTGGSSIIDADGELVNSLVSGEGIIWGHIHTSSAKRQRILQARKPSAYQELLLNPFLWQEKKTREVPELQDFEVLSFALQDEYPTVEQLEKEIVDELGILNFTSENRVLVLSEIKLLNATHPSQIKTILKELAVKKNVYIVTSYSHLTIPHCYCLFPDGTIYEYREIHNDQEMMMSDSFVVVELPFVKIGLLTGKDVLYPESYRVLSSKGADVIAVSANKDFPIVLWEQKIMAHENDVIVAISSPRSLGQSLLFLHNSVSIQPVLGQPISLLHHFSEKNLINIRERPFMSRRKHHLYDALLMNTRSIEKGSSS